MSRLVVGAAISCTAFGIVVAPDVAHARATTQAGVYRIGGPTKAELAQLQQKARAGQAEAQYLLANAYKYGAGVPEDFKRYEKWLRLAANQGHMKAQAQLGTALAGMSGATDAVAVNKVEALKWLILAAKKDTKGETMALVSASMLRRELRADIVAATEKEANAFRAQPARPVAD